MKAGLALAAALIALSAGSAEAYHCRPGKVWLRHARVCIAAHHVRTQHRHARRHHIRHARVMMQRHVEPPVVKRGDRLAPSQPAAAVILLPFYDVPSSTMLHRPTDPRWRL